MSGPYIIDRDVREFVSGGHLYVSACLREPGTCRLTVNYREVTPTTVCPMNRGGRVMSWLFDCGEVPDRSRVILQAHDRRFLSWQISDGRWMRGWPAPPWPKHPWADIFEKPKRKRKPQRRW